MTAFTIGDRVRVTSSAIGRVGRVGTIVRIHHELRHYRNAVRFDDGYTTLYHDQHLELVDARNHMDGAASTTASSSPSPGVETRRLANSQDLDYVGRTEAES